MYHLPCNLHRKPSFLPIKKGWSLTLHLAPPPLLMGGTVAAPQTGLTSYQIGGIWDIPGQSVAILDIYLNCFHWHRRPHANLSYKESLYNDL